MMRLQLLFILILTSTNTKSQTTIWLGNKDYVAITPHVYILKDTNSRLTIQTVSSERLVDKFNLSNQSVLHFGFTHSTYWLRFTVENDTKDSLLLELSHAFIPNADLYSRNQAGRWIVYKSGSKINIRDRIIKDHNQFFPLLPGKQEYYLHIIPSVHPVPIRIWNARAYQINTGRQRIIYGVYSGILLFAIGINLLLFFVLKRTYYLLYSILILLYLLTAAGVMEGFILYLFPNTNLTYTYTVIPVLDMPAFIAYCISFLDLKIYSRKLYRFSKYACACLLLYLIGLHFMPQLLVFLINYISALLVFVLAIYISVFVGRKGNKMGYYFAIAYCIWFLMIFMDELYIQTGMPTHVFELSYVSIAVFMEAFLLAILLAKRFEWDKKREEQERLEIERSITIMQQHFKQEILQAQLEIQEQTFETISQEIHDNIGQVLSLIKLNINTLHLGTENKMADTKMLVSKAITDLRNLSQSMHGSRISDIGLQTAIKNELRIIENTGLFNTKLEITGTLYPIEPQKEIILFRILQECINNTIKHSGANQVAIELKYETDAFMLIISDNGKGFDKFNLLQSHAGVGLRSMENRAKLIGGTLSIKSIIGDGTIIKILIMR